MLLFFQVGTSLSSRECLTSVKTMTSLRWKPDSFYNFFYQKADTLAQVVLGHEMAHSVIGHTAEQLTRASFIQVSTNLRVGAGRRYQPLAYVYFHHQQILSQVNPQLILLVPFALLWAALPNDGVALVADWFFQKVCSLLSIGCWGLIVSATILNVVTSTDWWIPKFSFF